MQEAVPVGTGAMAAILGLDLAVVEGVCREAAEAEVVEVANVNSRARWWWPVTRRPWSEPPAGRGPGRTAEHHAAGERSFHCRLMQPAADRLAEVLAGVAVADPAIRWSGTWTPA